MLVMFVNFMFSNIVFMHIHTGLDGGRVVHSHPYFPSSHHTHSAASLDIVAGFNAAAASAKSPGHTVLMMPHQRLIAIIEACMECEPVYVAVCSLSLRAPPAA